MCTRLVKPYRKPTRRHGYKVVFTQGGKINKRIAKKVRKNPHRYHPHQVAEANTKKCGGK